MPMPAGWLGMAMWDSRGMLASWLEPDEGRLVTWPVLVEPLALLGERLLGGGQCWITLGAAGGA